VPEWVLTDTRGYVVVYEVSHPCLYSVVVTIFLQGMKHVPTWS